VRLAVASIILVTPEVRPIIFDSSENTPATFERVTCPALTDVTLPEA